MTLNMTTPIVTGNEKEGDDAEMGDVKEPAKDKTPEKPGPASPGYVA